MKASINTDTGLLIESQSDADDVTLIANANAAGFANVQIVSLTDAELATFIAMRNVASVPLANAKLLAIGNTYSDVDSTYAVAVGNRAEEYRQAEAAALAYQAAGYSGAVSEYISSWAMTNTPMTNAQSADAIIFRAAALRAAMVSMRTQRFVSQAAMRAANTHTELDTAVATWGAFISATRSALT